MATRWMTSGRADAAVGERELATDATLRVRPRREPLSVRVVSGTVLVTREGDPEDHVLLPGMELRVAGRGLAVAWALSPARLVVAEVARAPRAAPASPAGLAGALDSSWARR